MYFHVINHTVKVATLSVDSKFIYDTKIKALNMLHAYIRVMLPGVPVNDDVEYSWSSR